MEKIYYVKNASTDPRYNLALEEMLLTRRREAPVFFLWRNEPTVVIGRGQNAPDEVRLDLARERKIHVIRRKTGGGAVYHDLGNVNFSFVEPYDSERPAALSYYVHPIADALISMDIPAVFSGRNDIVADLQTTDAPGSLQRFKVCGTAYRIWRDRILAHGCILFDTDLSVLSSLLTPEKGKLARHGIASVRSRVANLAPLLPGISTEEFMELLHHLVIAQAKSAAELTLTPEDFQMIRILMRDYPYLE